MEWKLALIQIEKAAKWAEINDSEVYERLLWSINKINNSHKQAPAALKDKAPKVEIVLKKAKVPKGSSGIDFSKSSPIIKGDSLCDLCKKRHLSCRKCITKGGVPMIVCSNCFSHELVTS